MGPRLLSRGKIDHQHGPVAHMLASMGPRLLSRGKRSAFVSFLPLPIRFNGAAAVEPRKGRRPCGSVA